MVIATTHFKHTCSNRMQRIVSNEQHPDIDFWLHATTCCHIYVQKQQHFLRNLTPTKIPLYNPFMVVHHNLLWCQFLSLVYETKLVAQKWHGFK